MKIALLAAATLLGLAACERTIVDDFRACPPYIAYAVVVTVQDSVTGANVTPGATLVLRDGAGAPVDSVVAPPGVTSRGLFGPAGTVTVAVRQSGYQTWTKTGITVRESEDGCTVQTVDLVARLRPAP